jgi:hypothetical protein
MAPLEEGDPPLRDQPPDVPDRDAQVLGDPRDVEQAR